MFAKRLTIATTLSLIVSRVSSRRPVALVPVFSPWTPGPPPMGEELPHVEDKYIYICIVVFLRASREGDGGGINRAKHDLVQPIRYTQLRAISGETYQQNIATNPLFSEPHREPFAILKSRGTQGNRIF